jgi:hypothetical protein
MIYSIDIKTVVIFALIELFAVSAVIWLIFA